MDNQSNKINFWLTLIAIAATLALIYSAYAYNIVIYRQTKSFLATISGVADVNIFYQKADDFLTPYNYSQSIIRSQLLDFAAGQNIFRETDGPFVKLGDKIIGAMEEYVNKEGIDARDYIRLSEAYNDRAEADPAYFQKSEAVLRRALALAPRRQEVYYHLAFTLAGAGKNKEAVAVAQRAADLEPTVARARYMLGVILSLTGDQAAGEAEIEKALAMDGGLFLMGQDSQNLLNIYGANFVRYVQQRDLAGVEKAIARLKQFQPDAASALDKLLQLARQGKWWELDGEVEKIINSPNF